ncbi:MAG: hypothetical protein D6748_14735 [Calditrichaeota bacterium]|nr:MAG: hypothetical protein D6748_14735 [Calditrichota bacterium]
MNKIRKIKTDAFLVLLIGLFTLFLTYQFRWGIFITTSKPDESGVGNEVMQQAGYEVITTDSIPLDTIFIENPDYYVDGVEKILNRWRQLYADRVANLRNARDVFKRPYAEKIRSGTAGRKSIDSENIKRQKGSIISNTNFRKQADLPAVDFSPIWDVLDHIQMKNDYLLDYVYYFDGFSGIPLLYGRSQNEPPYPNLNRIPNWSKYLYQHHIQESLDRPFFSSIQLDQTPLSYFQLAVLSLYCDHFLLYWHSTYRDEILLTNNRKLEKLRESSAMQMENMVDTSVAETIGWLKANLAHQKLEPFVVLKDTSVQIVFYYFTNWGGVYKVDWEVSREYPHEEIQFVRRNVLEYNSGISF